ncbi:hypothetical protein [Longimicrobium terrae]|uniref:Uncharacterized protein n=1 Tax=Longimicrobium terrae TaxID=1639882 RepID=A0A841GX69_9BACT|nr:hypothetical protein [Longimicrobium terrae]MBB4635959.1 hypothetical protein [Longimicrobium terrae]MBB6070355.1 hypothetical protein [Longimicrobium terrae]NNC30852.1 hypothetical protein [Longimicrobium terrae]
MGLPWAPVNESDPAHVADLLELPRSPRGGRKRVCPFCGGQSFAPLRRAFFCYSGCGGRAYSIVDTAAARWNAGPPDACLRLAALLGIPASESTVPWAAVREHGTGAVAAVLGLRAGDAAGTWDCPSCGAAGTLRARGRHWRCASPGCAGDRHRGWRSHVDVAAAAWGISAWEACIRLGDALGVRPPSAPRARSAPAPPPVPTPGAREVALAALATRPGACAPAALYRLLLDQLRLGALGRGELERRGIDAVRAEAYGFRSAEPGDWARRVRPFLAAFSEDELVAAGFPLLPAPAGRPQGPRLRWWPGLGRAPLLVVPVWDADRLAGVRFRNLGDPGVTRCPRYASPKDAGPDAPFHAAALDSGSPTLHVVEGELNAHVLVESPYGARATGLPGAWTWKDDWALRIPDETEHVVGWFDGDPAGEKGARRVRDSLARVRGNQWARTRWRALLLERDASDLHAAGLLGGLLATRPWILQDTAALWLDRDPDGPPGPTTTPPE